MTISRCSLNLPHDILAQVFDYLDCENLSVIKAIRLFRSFLHLQNQIHTLRRMEQVICLQTFFSRIENESEESAPRISLQKGMESLQCKEMVPVGQSFNPSPVLSFLFPTPDSVAQHITMKEDVAPFFASVGRATFYGPFAITTDRIFSRTYLTNFKAQTRHPLGEDELSYREGDTVGFSSPQSTTVIPYLNRVIFSFSAGEIGIREIVPDDFENIKSILIPPIEQQHTGSITTVVVTLDGQFIITGSVDQQIKVWNLEGECLNTLFGHQSSISSIHLSPDGKTMFSTATTSPEIGVWDLTTKQFLYSLDVHKQGNTITISPDGKTMAIRSIHSSKIQVFDLKTRKETFLLKDHRRGISSLAIDPTSKLLFSGSYDNTVKIWDIQTGTCRGSLIGHISNRPDCRNEISCLTLNQDGRLLFVGSRNGSIQVWDLKNKTILHTLLPTISEITSTTLSDDGLYFCAATEREAFVWDLASFKNLTDDQKKRICENTEKFAKNFFPPIKKEAQ